MDGGAWWAAVHGVTEGQTQLSDFTFTFHFHALEKEMATHSSVLAWRIPGTGEPAVYGVAQSRTRLKRHRRRSSLLGFPGDSVIKNLLANVGDMGSIPELGRSPEEGNGNPLQYYCLENPMDGGAR